MLPGRRARAHDARADHVRRALRPRLRGRGVPRLHASRDRRGARRGRRRHATARGHAERRQADRPAALRERPGAALHAEPPPLDAQPRLRRSGRAHRPRTRCCSTTAPRRPRTPSWALPVEDRGARQRRSAAAARSSSRSCRSAGARASASSWATSSATAGSPTSQTGWVYGGDDIDDGLLDSHEGMLARARSAASPARRCSNGTVQLRAGSEAVRDVLPLARRRAPVARTRSACRRASSRRRPRSRPRSCAGSSAPTAASPVEAARRAATSGLGSRSEALLKDVQRLLNAFGIRGRIYPTRGSEPAHFATRARTGRRSSTSSRQGSTCGSRAPISSASRAEIGFSTPRKQAALEALLDEPTRYRRSARRSARRARGRRPGGRLQPHRAAPPLVHRGRRRRCQLLAST